MRGALDISPAIEVAGSARSLRASSALRRIVKPREQQAHPRRIATEILLITLIVYTPLGHALFGTTPIALVVWLFFIPFAPGMLTLEELRKWLVRARPNPLQLPSSKNTF